MDIPDIIINSVQLAHNVVRLDDDIGSHEADFQQNLLVYFQPANQRFSSCFGKAYSLS